MIVVPALFLTARAVEERVYDRATQDLQRSGEALAFHWSLENEVLVSDVRVRALEAGLADAMLAGDSARVHRLLTRDLSPGRVALATDSLARPLVGPPIDSATIWRGVGRGSMVASVEDAGSPLRLAVWPVWADDRVAGIIGVGVRLDTALVTRMHEATGHHLALVVGDSVVSSSFAETVTGEVAAINLSTVLARGGTWRRDLNGRPYLYAVHSLPARGDLEAAALLFQPVAEELRVAGGIRRSLLGIGLAALLVALVLAGLVARIVARPAQTLAAAAADLARGNYEAPLPRASHDEIGQLAASFGEMRAAIAEREQRLRSAQAELVHREKLAAMGRLVAQLSHEINNPIYNIQNCLEALERRGRPDDPNREFLSLAQDELSRMAALTRRLLEQSRPLSEEAVSLNLNEVAERVLSLARRKLESHGVRVERAFTEALPDVVAHPDAMQEVLSNLVENAADAMHRGGTLRVATRGVDDVVEVTVADTGTGIASEDLPHVFEAFFTTKPGVRGVGLGLFVCEGIIRGHRGTLRVESEPGRGARFTMRLPLLVMDAADEAGGGDSEPDAAVGAAPTNIPHS